MPENTRRHVVVEPSYRFSVEDRADQIAEGITSAQIATMLYRTENRNCSPW